MIDLAHLERTHPRSAGWKTFPFPFGTRQETGCAGACQAEPGNQSALCSEVRYRDSRSGQLTYQPFLPCLEPVSA